jgi:RNA polymerase sigma factor (sigma-70 family)
MNEDKDRNPTRRSLLLRLQNVLDNDSWKEFFETYWRLLYGAALKAGLSDVEAEDVVQEIIISVVKELPQLKYDEGKSFKGWLLTLTSWRIADHYRKQKRQVPIDREAAPGETGTKIVERVADPAGIRLETVWDEEWEMNVAEVAIERVKQKVDPGDYQIFDLYVFKQWSVARVAETLNIRKGRIYSIKHRIGALIKQEADKLRKRPDLMMACA